MAEDEEDYMSETFLRGLDDVRPGLKPPSRKRRASIPKAGSDKGAAAATRAKQRKMHEKAARQEGLSRPLSEDNKGFSMLMRMGFKEGEGLGKLGEGRRTPISIAVKGGRGGLGREHHLKEKQVEKKAKQVTIERDFRQRRLEVLLERRVTGDLRKSQAACELLDSRENVLLPELKWFWPSMEVMGIEGKETREEEEEGEEEEEAEEEEEELSCSEKLTVLTRYLRSQHFYCIWCGTAYQDMEDMNEHCPGGTAELHDE